MTAHDDLTFRTFDSLHVPLAREPQVDGWIQAVSRGFHEGRFDDAMIDRWLRYVNADGAVLHGAWARPQLGAGEVPVATLASWDQDVNVGDGRRLPLHMITDITVSPTHRRRGLLRRFLGEDLKEAARHGLPLAGLTVSEGSIYGRFGFGLATSCRHVEVDVTSRFAFRNEVTPADGELVLLAPGPETVEAMEAVFARFHETTRGSVARPAFYRGFAEDGHDYETRSPDGKRHVCVLVDDGVPLGYVSYRHQGRPDDQGGRSTVTVRDMVATSPAAYLRLWRFLADLDLVERVTWGRAPLADPLPWALVDPFCVRTVRTTDLLWVRVLDVVVALEARPWGADGDVVLEIDDPLGYAAGRFHVVVGDGRAEVRPTEDDAHVRLAADTLGPWYLGGESVRTLASAGRVHGEATALRGFAAMADVAPQPYCLTGF